MCYTIAVVGCSARKRGEKADVLSKTQSLNKLPAVLNLGQRMNAQMRACATWATIEEHDKILDMACGDGTLLRFFNDRYRVNLCGICDAPEQARAVREQLDDADVIYGQMEDIPWRNDTFDALLLPAAIRGDGRRVMEEAYRVLRTGGQLVMSMPLFSVLQEGDLSRREVMRIMQEAGFQEVSFRTSGLYGAVVGWKKKDVPA